MRDILKEIQEKLDEIEQKEHVKILHAVESGSRSWGFASPDSDYDVRFVYVRPMEAYLSIEEPKDVIEWQLDEVLDINGWDIKKALKLFAKGNATLFEWSGSPVVYRTTPEWERIREVSKQYFSEKTAVCHYYGTANSTYMEYLQGERVRYKKYFYALRPLLATEYIERYHEAPPVLFDDLLKLELPETFRNALDELLEIKKRTTEKEENPQMPVIKAFIEEELKKQKEIGDALPNDHNRNLEALNQIFRELLEGSAKKNRPLWRIKHIFDGDFGCEERPAGQEGLMVSVTLENETGEKRYVTVADEWLRARELDVGSTWPKDD